jgi:hypothetical protein
MDNSGDALPYHERPIDDRPVHTTDLPATPQRDRSIPARAWIEAPDDLLHLGDDLPGTPEAQYKRRIGPWLLWRAGPATKADARYWAAHVDTLESAGTDTGSLSGPTVVTFRLHADGTATGTGPSGTVHQRFRSWKEDLRDHP